MSGQNNGTGHPLWFRCAKCRQKVNRSLGTLARVVRSGRERAMTGSGRGSRMGRAAREYRCNDCGHVGWSKHVDLESATLEPWGGK